MAIDGKGRPTKEQARKQKELQGWLNAIAAYEREFQPWEKRVEQILKKYRDDRREGDTSLARFNILWSNIQTLVPATFSRIPQPDVSRRFRDNDPVGRVASLILERALEFEVSHYPDYRASLTQTVADRFLGGRGTVWARYEPHITAVKKSQPVNGLEVSEDVDEPDEQLEYECAPIDYVHWKDFGHSVARTWEEVTKVWRRVYLTRQACIERFGSDIGNRIPLDSTPDQSKRTDKAENQDYARALIYEGWDKEKKKAVWISKTLNEIVDEKDDPLNLEGFFPCPCPLYATLTNDSLIPVPDFTLYQDQAKELDTLSDRIDGLVKALQVKGCYDASIPELARLFTEGGNTDMIPVKNWGGFAEKQGLAGAISLVDLKPIAEALKEAYTAMDEIKGQIYEITGISDIVRGQTNPNETLGAQELKGKYASLRLKSYQDEVAVFATECLRLKAQIMCGKFDPETLAKISAVDQLADEDKQFVGPAMQLLFGERLNNPDADLGHYENPIRSFRIDIAADTLVQADEENDQNQRMEFLRATGAFLKEATVAGQTAPDLVPLLGKMLLFGIRGFKIGKTIEGAFDEFEQKAKLALAQPQQPKQDPAMAKVQAQAQADQMRMQMENQHEQQRMAAEQQKQVAEAQRAQQQAQMEMMMERNRAQMQAQLDAQQSAQEAAFARFEALLKAKTAVEVAEIGAGATLQAAQISAANAGASDG